jgi:hypothetical protein
LIVLAVLIVLIILVVLVVLMVLKVLKVLKVLEVLEFLKVLVCKGSFGGCQGQPSARPWHLLLRSLGLAALLSSSSVHLSLYSGYYPTLYHIVLFHRLPI